MYFRLHNHCRLVEGFRRGAIYDLATGKVLSINQGAVRLLQECHSGSLEQVLNISLPENQPYVNFLQELIVKKVGSVYLLEPDSLTAVQAPTEPKLDFLWLEITANCNNTCLHCYAASGPCAHEDKVPKERWLKAISEGKSAGASAIQLIGGEPLLYAHWRDLVLKACEEGYEYIEIFTNATLITDADIEFFQINGVRLATTIYADNAEVHDKVTLHPGSFQKTMTNIKKILANNIPLRIASIIMKANEDQAENIMKLCSELGVEVNPPDVVRPTGRGDDQEILPEKYTKPPVKPPFYTSQENFSRAHYFHSCLAGKIAITATGEVIPCIFARNQSLGNILTNTLAEILAGEKLTTCWHTTKDQVEKCRDCEYRYACSDCRPLAQGSDPDKRWLACSAGCLYNPYTGIWEDNR
ncbi:MAG: radical SAM protein [Pelosinus sp.]|nr:radical SAM protein [Pelosinus sp.]